MLSVSYANLVPNQPNSAAGDHIVINGNEMNYETDKNISRVIGNARAEKGIGPERQILTAQEFVVHFRDRQKDTKSNPEQTVSSGQDIEIIEAKGNVVMIKGDLVMKADNCVYSSEMAKDPKKADQTDCRDNVSVTKAGHYIQGDEGTVNLKTGVYTVRKSPNSKRKKVNALIQTPNPAEKSTTQTRG
jgi:lipopolysaccharide export system protein LptA